MGYCPWPSSRGTYHYASHTHRRFAGYLDGIAEFADRREYRGSRDATLTMREALNAALREHGYAIVDNLVR